jgi:hypothetical protein
MQAGDADPGLRLRRRRREVALRTIITEMNRSYLTSTLRLPYDRRENSGFDDLF